jgi:hypothetical protein
MNDSEIFSDVLNLGDPGGQPRIASSVDFLRGTLHTIEFRSNDELICQRFFYENQSEYSIDPPSRAFLTRELLMEWINTSYNNQRRSLISISQLPYPSKPRLSIVKTFSDTRVVSSIIAIGIIATISFLLISDLRYQQSSRSPGDNSPVTLLEIPDVLSNALAIILGFYFGSEVGKRRGKVEESQSEED